MIIGFLTVGLFIALVILGTRIAFAGIISGLIGLMAYYGVHAAIEGLRIQIFSTSVNYGMTVVPLFVLMGYFGFHSGIGVEIYNAGRDWLGSKKGGLAMGTIMAGAFFGAISGSSTASAALFARLSIPEMDKYGYDRRLSVAAVAAGGTLDSMIPPSTIIVIYGLLTEQSIVKLLIAGIIPGFLNAFVFCLGIYLMVLKNPKLCAPIIPTSFKVKLQSLRPLWGVFLIFVVSIGGLYLGVFTATEAGAIGAASMFLVALVRRMLTWEKVKASLIETARTSCMIFFIMIGIQLFTTVTVATGAAGALVNWAMSLPPSLLLWGIIGVYLIFGCFIGVLGMMVTTIPFIYPIIMAAGFNPIWFGIIVVMLCEIAMLTPPVGINVYLVSNISGTPLHTCFRAILPFVIMQLVFLLLLIAFPEIILVLPNRIG